MSGCIIITMTFTDGITLLGITERKRAPCNSQGRAHVFPSITPAWTWAPHSVLLKSLRKVPVTLPKTWCQLRAAGVLGERKCDCLKSPARAGRRRLPRRVRLESGSAFLSSSSGGGRRAQTDGVSRGKNVENGAFVTFLPSQVNGKRSLSEIRFCGFVFVGLFFGHFFGLFLQST